VNPVRHLNSGARALRSAPIPKKALRRLEEGRRRTPPRDYALCARTWTPAIRKRALRRLEEEAAQGMEVARLPRV